MQTVLLDAVADPARAIAAAVALLKEGAVVALPTETVYGLAGNAFDSLAVARIFEAKNRPAFDPLIVHVADLAMLQSVAVVKDGLVERLIERFWPGPLTLLLPKRENVSDLVTSGSPLVAVRLPAHALFRAVLEQLGQPLAAPSANPFGRISPTTAIHVRSTLDGRIPLILDGGNCQHGLESTIVYPREGGLHVLRAGPITAEALAAFGPVHPGSAVPQVVPGQLASHYAPRKPLALIDSPGEVADRANAGYLALSVLPEGFGAGEVLSATGNLVEAASNLFAALHRLDAAAIDRIYAERLPGVGLGRAIMDRLERAAAKR